jgi:hypothetical protein
MRLRKAFLLALLPLSALPLAPAQTASTIPASMAATAVPPLIQYSGVAKDADNKPLTGEVILSFLVFRDEEGGSPLWVESQSLTLDSAGHYQAQLGAASLNGLPLDLFASGEARWLEVQIAGQKPQARVLLVSVPYALKAADAATLGGLPPSAFALVGEKGAATAAAASAITPDLASDVTTTGGTSGYLPVFTGASTVVDSILFQSATGIGIGDVPNSSAVLDVNGKSIWRGNLNVSRTGNATPTAAFNSYPFSFDASAYNSDYAADVSPVFYWQAEPINNNTALPGATMNLLYNKNSGTGAETGLYFNSNGTINFATGQTFPGAGTITGVTAGTALTGGGTTGAVALNVDTTKVPLLATANHFTGNQSVTGTLSATGSVSSSSQLISTVANGTAPLAVSSTTVVPNLNASLLGGLAASAFASTAASNSFTAVQSFSQIGVGTTTPRSLLEISTRALAALGPVLTLTNTAGGASAESALDFNTVLPSTTGTYNPMARIVAQDALHYSDNLLFQSNLPGAANSGLQTNIIIQSNGQVGVNTTAPGAQMEVDANAGLGYDAFYAYGATSSAGVGSVGVEGYGGAGLSSGSGGSAGYFSGGYAEGTGPGGDGVDAFAGGSADSSAAQGYAGYFAGNVTVTGTVSAGAKDFEIDDPLDPANKYLDHASVESSEMVNIYSGNVTTDELGIATVQLPEWFESENTDFRYQLTVVGKFAQAIISQEISNHQFKISTNSSWTKVSWQVTGVRQDAYAKAHPLVVEREKPGVERGFYAHPELYGQPAEKQTQWARRPEAMRRMKAAQTPQKMSAAKVATQ